MELLPLLGSALLLIGLVLYLARPLLLANAASTVAQGSDVRPLYERKEQLLGAIVELELDREIGKIPAEDFQRNFAQLEAEALAVIAELDQLNGAGSDEMERRIEAEVAALRQQGAGRQEADPAAEKAPRYNYCANCGAPRREGDRFCPQCGVALAEYG